MTQNKNNKRSAFDYFTEVLGWLQIVASPLLLGLIAGFLIYISQPNSTRLIIGIAVAVVGLISGMIWATRVWKKQGKINFVSRISATPDLDNSTNSETPFDKKYSDEGVFKYNDEGFTITTEKFSTKLNWDDITEIHVFKTDLMTIDRIDMKIVCGDKALNISEDVPGWYQFVIKTKEIFPTIPKDWDIKIVQPAFETNYTTIYKKVDTE